MQKNEPKYDISVEVLQFTEPISTTSVADDDKFYEVDRPTASTANAQSFAKHVDAHSVHSTSKSPIKSTNIPSYSNGTSTPIGGETELLQLIANGEGNTTTRATAEGYSSPYDVTLDYGSFCDDKTKPITTMTLTEIKATQKTILNHKNNDMNSSAVGLLQIVGTTLAYLQRRMKLPDSAIFNKELQDKMGIELLKRRGLESYRSGNITKSQYQEYLSKEWDSIAKDTRNRNYRDTHDAKTTTELLSPHLDAIRTKRNTSKTPIIDNAVSNSDTSIKYYQQYVTPSSSVQHANKGIHCPNSSWMVREFGKPGKNITSRVDNSKLFKKYRMPTKDVGPFRVTGFPPFITLLKHVFAELKQTHPELYDYIQSDGMQACRKVAGSSRSLSSHSWGHAIDIKVGAKRSKYGYSKHLRAFEILIPLMNKYKIFSGITFGKMDSMHFQVSKELYKDWATQGVLTYGNGTFHYSGEPTVTPPNPEDTQENHEIESNPKNKIEDSNEVAPGSVGHTIGSGVHKKIIKKAKESFVTRNREFQTHTFIPEYVVDYSIEANLKYHMQIHTLTINNVSALGFTILQNPENIIKVTTHDQSGTMPDKEQFLTVKHVQVVGREANDTYVLRVSCFGSMIDRMLNQPMYSVILEDATPYQAISTIMGNINDRFETTTNIKTNTQGVNYTYEQIFIPSKPVFAQLEDVINQVYKLDHTPTNWILVDTSYNEYMRPMALTLVIINTNQLDRMDKTRMENLSPNGINLSSLTNTRAMVDPAKTPMLFQSNVNLTQPNGQVFFKQRTAIVDGFKSSGGKLKPITHQIPSTMTLDVTLTDTIDEHNNRMTAVKQWVARTPQTSRFRTSNVSIDKVSNCEAYSFKGGEYRYTLLDYVLRFTRAGDEDKHANQFHSAELAGLLFHFRK